MPSDPQIPIPPAAPADKSCIETLVQQCLTVQGQAVAAAEAEIDDIVARLYGLTEAEVAIIREQTGDSLVVQKSQVVSI